MSHYKSSHSQRYRDPATSTSSSSSSRSSPRQNQSQNFAYFETYSPASPPYISPYPPTSQVAQSLPVPSSTSQPSAVPNRSTYLDPSSASMSAYSSASDQESVYSSPGPQDYQVVTAGMMANPRSLSSVSGYDLFNRKGLLDFDSRKCFMFYC